MLTSTRLVRAAVLLICARLSHVEQITSIAALCSQLSQQENSHQNYTLFLFNQRERERDKNFTCSGSIKLVFRPLLGWRRFQRYLRTHGYMGQSYSVHWQSNCSARDLTPLVPDATCEPGASVTSSSDS